MKLDPELLAEITKAAPEAGAKLKAAADAAAAEVDGLKASTAKLADDAKAAQKKADAAEKKAEAAAKGGSDEVAKLRADAEAATKNAEAATNALREHKIKSALGEKLGIGDATKRRDALALLGVPDGVTMDEKTGEIIGADKAIADFKAARGYLFDDAEAGNGGGSPTGAPKPKAGKEPSSADKIKAAEGAFGALFPTGKQNNAKA